MAGAPQTLPLQSVSDLMAPGVPLPFRVLDAQGRLLLAQGQIVMDVRQLQALLERGACVVVTEVEAERQARTRGGSGAAGMVLSTRKLTWFDRWERHIWDIDEALRALGRDPGVAGLLDKLVLQQMSLVSGQPDAALFTLVRQDDRRFALYALVHARFAAVVAQLTATVLGWPPERVRNAVAVALTMNASIVDLQARMAEQPEPPTKKQIEQIRAHPSASADLLRASGVSDDDWLAGVQEHHEQLGGGGYPRAIAAPGDLASVVRAADVFTAKISPRAFRAPLSAQMAARQLFQEAGGGGVAGSLIKAVGVYPPGELVRLKNGEAGVVVRRAGAGLEVAVLLAANGRAAAGALRRDTSQAEFAVSGALAERTGLPRVLPEQVFGLLYA
jgi:hypothetical protein